MIEHNLPNEDDAPWLDCMDGFKQLTKQQEASMTDLSPTALAVMTAGTMGNSNVINDPVYRQCIAAALQAAADQVAPGDAVEPRNYLPVALECQRIRAELLAIVAELEDAQ